MPNEDVNTNSPAGRSDLDSTIDAAPAAAPVQPPAQTDSPDGQSTASRELVSREELDKAIKERQAAKLRARNAEAKLAQLQEQLKHAADPQPVESEAAESSDSVTEAAAAAESDDSAQQQLQQKLSATQEQLAHLLRDRELHAAAVAAGAINPEQIVALLAHRVRMVEQEDGQFSPQFLDDRGRAAVDGAGKPIDAETFVRSYLSQPQNANLVRATSAGGSGARLAGLPGQVSGLPQTLADFNSLPPSERRQAALRLSRAERQALLGLPGADRVGYL